MEKITIKEIFESEIGHKMNDYIIEHFTNMLTKYNEKLFFQAFDVVINRNKVINFETPTDLVRYMYAVLKNMALSTSWEE